MTITSKNITPKDIKKILNMIRRGTRAEAIARHGAFGERSVEPGNYYGCFLEQRDMLREYIYGTSDLVQLGVRWGILKSDEDLAKERAQANKKKKKKKKKMQRQLF